MSHRWYYQVNISQYTPPTIKKCNVNVVYYIAYKMNKELIIVELKQKNASRSKYIIKMLTANREPNIYNLEVKVSSDIGYI